MEFAKVVIGLCLGLMVASVASDASSGRPVRNLNDLDIGNEHQHQHLDADDPDFSGIVDFSNAEPGPGGSWCITKTNYVDHMVKDQIKECWHENVTQCHDTYVTEFLPSQEQKCEESFWKSCKIDFREMPYNYTMKQCHTPLMKTCDPSYGKPEIVCKTWFESECNTTYTETTPNVEDKPNTWCQKVPRKICAPDNCRMVPGKEECNNKVLVSTVQKPTEICDLQPQQHCRLITKLTPHLLSKEVCKSIPKEVCHLALTPAKTVKKPVTLKWCTRKKDGQASRPKPSYLPPPPSGLPQQSLNPIPSSSNRKNQRVNPRPVYKASPSSNTYSPPTYSSPTQRPFDNFQVRSEDNVAFPSEIKVTKFRPPPVNKLIKEELEQEEADEPEVETFQAEIVDVAEPAATERQKTPSLQLPVAFRAQLNQAGLLDEEDSSEEQEELVQIVQLDDDDEDDHEGLDLVEIDGKPVLSTVEPVLAPITDNLSGGFGELGAAIGDLDSPRGFSRPFLRRRR